MADSLSLSDNVKVATARESTSGVRAVSALGSGTAKLVVGRGLSVAIGFGTMPIIARLFTPSDFGVAGIVGAIATWLTAFACLSYAQAIPLSVSKFETRALVWLCVLLTIGLLVPVTLVPLLGSGLLSDVIGEPTLKMLLWFVPVTFLFGSLSKVVAYTCSKEGRFGLLSVSGFSKVNVGRAVLIGLGWFLGGGALYLLLGNMIGAAVGLLVAAPLVLRILLKRIRDERPSDCTLISVAKRHRQFPKVQVWNSALNVASRSLPVLIMGACFGSSMVGYYFFGWKLLVLPMAILGSSFAQVFYPEAASEWNTTGAMSETVRQTVRTLSLICAFPVVAVGVLGPLLFTTFFGAVWHEAGVYSQILAPYLLMQLVASPVSKVFLIRQRAGLLLAYNITLLIGRSGAVVLGGQVGEPRVALICYSAVAFFVYFHLLATALRLGRTARRPVFSQLLREASRAFLLLLPAACAYWAARSAWLSLALLCAAGLAYYGWLYRRDPLVRAKIHSVTSRLHRRES